MKTITSRENPSVKRWKALAHSARDRRKLGQTVLDGPHLLRAAIEAGVALEEIVVSEQGARSAEIVALVEACPEVPSFLLPDALFSLASPVDAPSGVLAVMAMRSAATGATATTAESAGESDRKSDCEGGEASSAVAFRHEDTLQVSLLIVDGVQDPGNLGTLLRTAAAAGLRTVVLTPGCAQAWSPRVLRAGMGAHFRLQLHEQADASAWLRGFAGKVVATGLVAHARDLFETDLSGPVAWMFGAEGAGLSDALFTRATDIVRIPMAEGIESLNVASAAAICLFEQRRQQTR